MTKKLDPEHLRTSLEGIRHLLSHLHGEITTLSANTSQVLHVLRKLEGKVEVDELTQLMRRESFFEKWETLLQECQRLGENCGLLMVDLDHFKSINDTFGHAEGDEVLRRVAHLFKQFETPNVFCGRFGGEEFVIGVRGSESHMLGIAEMIRRRCENLRGSSQSRWKCTLSVGAASSQQAGYDAKSLFEAADAALYRAKKKGRNQVAA